MLPSRQTGVRGQQKIENVDKNMTIPTALHWAGEMMCVTESALHSKPNQLYSPKRASAPKKGKRVTVSALRTSRLLRPASCVQAAFCGFHRFTSTVFDVWLLRGSRGELLFRPSFLCARFLMHLRLSALDEQGLRRFPSARFCFPSCEVLEGEVLFSFVRGS